jgi:hypothetical protein
LKEIFRLIVQVLECSNITPDRNLVILFSIAAAAAAAARYEVLTGGIEGAYVYTLLRDDQPQIYM